jgi:hypothetical protein
MTYETEWKQRKQSSTLTRSSHDNSADRCTEDQLELRKEYLRYRSHWFRQNSTVKRLFESPNDWIALTVCKGVSDNPPLNAAHNHGNQTRIEGG